MEVKHRPNPAGCCPADLIAKICKEEEGGSKAFQLDRKAFDNLENFRVSKSVKFIFDNKQLLSVFVEWEPSKDTMLLHSFDGGKTLIVQSYDTVEIKYQKPDNPDVFYFIEGE